MSGSENVNPPSVLVVGSANLDFVTRLPHLPAPGETVLGESYTTAPGGKGANQAVACARAGGEVAFCGALGEDPFAEPLLASLRESGVQDWTVRAPAPTGAAFISVSKEGENCIAVASGANGTLRPEQLPPLTGVGWLVLQLEIPLETVQAAAQAAREAGAQVVLNAAPARTLPPELLRLVDLLVVNEGELRTLTGATDTTLKKSLENQTLFPNGVSQRKYGAERRGRCGGAFPTSLKKSSAPYDLRAGVRQAQASGPRTVVVTLGERGCLALSGDDWTELPALPVPVRDTTGAGDTFVGVLVAALSRGEPFAAALRWAVAGSALACTREGAQPAMPGREEIQANLG